MTDCMAGRAVSSSSSLTLTELLQRYLQQSANYNAQGWGCSQLSSEHSAELRAGSDGPDCLGGTGSLSEPGRDRDRFCAGLPCLAWSAWDLSPSTNTNNTTGHLSPVIQRHHTRLIQQTKSNANNLLDIFHTLHITYT